MGETVGDTVGAGVLARIRLSFPDGLFQRGNAGFILGVHHHIVVPGRAALGSGGILTPRNCGHGQGDEKGVRGAGDHLRDLCLHQQI